jgi:hypothetical protein
VSPDRKQGSRGGAVREARRRREARRPPAAQAEALRRLPFPLARIEHLADLGCDSIQGFHLARPLPEADVACWLLTAPGLRAGPSRAGPDGLFEPLGRAGSTA